LRKIAYNGCVFWRIEVAGLIVVMSVMASGCGPVARDVTGDARYAKYTPAASYTLLAAAKLVRAKDDRFRTGTRYYLGKMEDDGADPRPGDEVLATLPAGTQLRMDRLLACRVSPHPPRSWEVVRPLARILDGPYAGTVVDLTEISHHKLVRELNADLALPASSQLRRTSPPPQRPTAHAPPAPTTARASSATTNRL
jgi:hypothetical protein